MRIISIDEDGVTFDDGTMVVHNHNQSCCEHVYADWQQLKDTTIWDENFNSIQVEGVECAGFRLNGYFVPCYNEQNGYYSDDLSIVIRGADGQLIKEIDISEFVEDRIY